MTPGAHDERTIASLTEAALPTTTDWSEAAKINQEPTQTYIARRARRTPRYRPAGAERKGGRLVARILDLQTGRTLSIHRRFGRFRHYQTDRPITSRALTRVAREQLQRARQHDDARLALRPQSTVKRVG